MRGNCETGEAGFVRGCCVESRDVRWLMEGQRMTYEGVGGRDIS